MPDNREPKSNGVAATAAAGGSPADNLEESMWRLKIQGGGEGAEAYPDRPGEPDCIYYLRTGSCGYGSHCRYNHPAYIGQGAQYRSELPERLGQPDCQYFLKTGTCKFGGTCKYNHPRDNHEVQPVPLNVLGLPMRLDEKSCPYYMRTGSCKFGIICKFNHPQPATAAYPMTGSSTYGSTRSSVAPPSGLPLIGGFSAWPISRPPYFSSPRMQGLPAYMPIVLPPSQGTMPMQQGWSTYTGTIGRISSTDFLGSNPSNSNNLVQSSTSVSVNLPERPDQPDCQYYMKTGSCKYGTTCKYHHPKELNPLGVSTLGPLGLPLRPGQAVCTYYSMYGNCKYGSACKFDHPMVGYYNYSVPAVSFASPSALTSQRNSQVVWTSAETSPPKSEASNGLRSSNSKEHANPIQTPTRTTSLSGSPTKQSG